MLKNMLIKGENYFVLKYLIDKRDFIGKVDLIYIDPPFATGSSFTVTEDRTATISKSSKGKVAYLDILQGKEYIDFLRNRLLLMKDIMSDRASIYLHIDSKVGHYVKIMMDDIFGVSNFKNDITRIKCNPKNFCKIGYSNIKDVIYFYTKTNKAIWNEPKEKYTENDLFKLFPKIDVRGRRYTTVPIHAPGETKNGLTGQLFKEKFPPKGRHWRTKVEVLECWDKEGLIEWSSKGNPRKIIYADEKDGKRIQDIWDFKDPQYPIYPTEKNINLMDLIIKTSSQENSIVMDCFCGSGTFLKSAHLNNRKWIGIDNSDIAIEVTKKRLNEIEENLFIKVPDYEYLDFV